VGEEIRKEEEKIEKAKNRKWINNGSENKTCDASKLTEYFKKGWKIREIKNSLKEHILNLSISHKR